jgi:trimeric autotransporter adhesin
MINVQRFPNSIPSKVISYPFRIFFCFVLWQLSACGGSRVWLPGPPPEVEGCEFLQFAFEVTAQTLVCDSLDDLATAATHDSVTVIRIKETAVAERLDLSGFRNLEKLEIKSANVGVLDLSRNLALREISLYMTGLTELHLPTAQLSTMFLSTPALTQLNAFGAKIRAVTLVSPLSLDVNALLTAQQMPQLRLVNFNLEEITLDELDSLTELSLANCQFAELHLPDQRPISLTVDGEAPGQLNIAAGRIQKLTLWDTKIESIRVAEPNSWTLLTLIDHHADSLDISGGASVTALQVEGGTLDTLSGATLPALQEVTITDAIIANLDLSANPALMSVWLRKTALDSLALPATAPLSRLNLDEVELAELDLPEYPNLKRIDILDTSLREFTTQTLAGLTEFFLRNTAISALALEKMPNLNNLTIVGHQLTGLDLSGNLQLEQLALSEVSGIADLDIVHLDLKQLVIFDSDLSCERLEEIHEAFSGLGLQMFSLPEFDAC